MARDNGMDNGMERMRETIARMKSERVAQGLPANPPPGFVPLAMGWTLFQRSKPLIQYAVTYASLCDKSDEIIDISDEHMAWIKSHEMDVILLRNVIGGIPTLNRSIDGIYSALSNYVRFETAGELVRELTLFIKHTRHKYGEYRIDHLTYDIHKDDEENEKARKEVTAEVERLEDVEYFTQEYDRLVAHYKDNI